MSNQVERYIGVKMINATPMNRQEYNDFRGWTLPADENGADDGYLVEYIDGGKANTSQYAGYVSWSPKDVFERAYRPTSGMTFGFAIEALKAGKKVARAGWNGKGMWICLVPDWDATPVSIGHTQMPADWQGYSAFIAVYTTNNTLVPWLASQTDMLAEDWMEVGDD